MSLLIPGTNSIKDTGYDVANSLRFDDGSSDYLSRTPSSGGNTKTWTFSTWIKRANIGVSAPMNLLGGEDSASRYSDVMIGTPSGVDDTFWFKQDTGTVAELRSTAVLRDPTAWYHLVFVYDSTNGTADDRMKMYVNGVQLTSFVVRTNVGSNVDSYVNSSGDINYVGSYQGSSKFLDGYLCETVLIDGTALTPTAFGEFDSDTGIWKPKDFKDDVTFGTNGFYLEYKESGTGTDSSGMGADTSGNNHHFAVSNLTSIDQCTDTCTNNFVTLNPLYNAYVDPTFSEGNLKITSGSGWAGAKATIGVSTGKWYWELKLTGTMSSHQHGVQQENVNEGAQNPQNTTGTTSFYNHDGGEMNTDSTFTTADYGTFSSGDIMGVALDMDAGSYGQITIYKNGSAIVSDFNLSSSSTLVMPHFSIDNSTVECNFGSPPYAISSGNADANGYGNFEYAPPTGFYAICSKNLAEYG